MLYQEEIKDLFSVSDDYVLVHCISADFALGAGIAKEFNKRYHVKKELFERYPDYIQEFTKTSNMYCFGDCLVTENERLILNLVTKKNYWNKPNPKCFYESLLNLRNIISQRNIKKIAMPLIGCGLDQLDWNWVSAKIKQVFEETDIEILVCKL